jgi:predicted flap endonuclease-1-like 5' DNA nuclease
LGTNNWKKTHGILLKKDDRGYSVQLPYGLEAYAPTKHMKKEDNSQAAVEDKLTVKVIEFNRDEKKIMVSHARYLEDVKREADENVKKEVDAESTRVKKAVEKQTSKVEVTTLGEIEGFSALKQQLENVSTAPKPVETPAAVEIKVEEPKVEAVIEEPKAEIKVSKKAETSAKSGKADDLKIIEGIGPKIAELLSKDGFDSFENLANTSFDQLKTILDNAGSRYKMHDPTSWPQQARLAADGKWDELKNLQDSLKGGKAEE